MKLFHQTLGQGGAPLACLHGFLGSGDNLWPLADHLKGGHRSLLMDLRGHGRSPHGRHYTVDAMADDVAETLGAAGFPSAAVLGHSLGGRVAMALALRHPERVERLVVADITMERMQPYFGVLLDALSAVPVATLKRRDEGEAWLRAVEPILETRRFLLKNLAPAPSGGFRWRMDVEGLKADHALLLEAVADGVPFRKPALLIRGDRSPFTKNGGEGLARMRRNFPDLRVLDLPGGHWIHVDAKDRFNGAVAEFLDQN